MKRVDLDVRGSAIDEIEVTTYLALNADGVFVEIPKPPPEPPRHSYRVVAVDRARGVVTLRSE